MEHLFTTHFLIMVCCKLSQDGKNVAVPGFFSLNSNKNYYAVQPQSGVANPYAVGLDKTSYPDYTQMSLSDVKNAAFRTYFNSNGGLPDLYVSPVTSTIDLRCEPLSSGNPDLAQ